MTPIFKKRLFRIKDIKRPPIFGGVHESQYRRILKRSIAALVVVSAIIGVIYSGNLPIRTKLSEGDIATEDIYAPYTFDYKFGINEKETERLKAKALQDTLDVYSTDPSYEKKTVEQVEVFFKGLLSLKDAPPEVSARTQQEFIASYTPGLTVHGLSLLLEHQDVESIKAEMLRLVKELPSLLIVEDDTLKELLGSEKRAISLIDPITKKKTKVGTKELTTLSNIKRPLEKLIRGSSFPDNKIMLAISSLLVKWIEPSTYYNKAETDTVRKSALSSVSPVLYLLKRLKGEIIVRKGQRVTKEHIIQLEAITSRYSMPDMHAHFWAIVVLMSLVAFLLLAYLKYLEPKIFADGKLLLLTGLVIVFCTISAKIIVASPLSSYLIPAAAAAMILTLLVNGSLAAIATVAVAIIAALIAGAKFEIFLVSIVGGIAAICTISRARHRSEIIKSGFFVGILNFVTICAIGIISNLDIGVYLKEGVWGIAGGITASAITMLLLPFFEILFKITTDIRLLELSDLNHPLLREMVTKASGTYHHSLIVGNLAEAACEAIGANALLGRVGSYYHDIGKLNKAEYFAENRQDSLDMHDNLSPSMSSLIITNHVKDGVVLAEKHKLGSAIKDIIDRHHGTGLVTYFYHQALEKTSEEKKISEESFRYTGQKPRTKETAVVMLADSAEAASRVLQNPTPARLKDLVRKIINNKFIDRQLDVCDLSLMDINKIAESFVRVLTGIYHSRVEYPGNGALKNAGDGKQRTKKDPDI